MNRQEVITSLALVSNDCEVVIDIADPSKKSKMAYQHFTIKEINTEDQPAIIYVNESIGKDAWSQYDIPNSPPAPPMRSSTELESLRLKRMALAIQVSELNNEIRLIEKDIQGQIKPTEVYPEGKGSIVKKQTDKQKEAAALMAKFKALTPQQQAAIMKLKGGK